MTAGRTESVPAVDREWLESLEVHPVGASSLRQQVLRTDASGMPLEWIDYREAVRLYCLGQVSYAFGSTLYTLHGGTNARTGRQTVIEINSMVATVGQSSNPGSLRGDYVPPLNNETLFKRDAWLCMYCGGRFPPSQLSRDHVRPFYQGGRDVWNNVVAACRRCNNQKASRTPEAGEYFSLMVFGLIGSIVFASGSGIRAVGMVVFGLILGMVGTDITQRRPSFFFRHPRAGRRDWVCPSCHGSFWNIRNHQEP